MNDGGSKEYDFFYKRDNICVIGPVNDGKHVFFKQLCGVNECYDFEVMKEIVEIGDDRLKIQVCTLKG